MDWFALGTLAVGFLFGFVTKALGRSRRNVRPSPEMQKALELQGLKPRCMCDHWFNEHEAGGGKCAQLVDFARDWDDWGRPKKKKPELVPCPCQGYLGPDPLLSTLWISDSLLPKKVNPS